jgi:hypothetical protein
VAPLAPDARTSAGSIVRPFVLALGLVAAVSALLQLIRTVAITLNGGCGWDGVQYCAMAAGEGPVRAPFSRRVLMPWIVQALPVDDPVTGFRIVNVVALLGAAAALVWLGRRAGIEDRWYLAALVALFALNPWTLRLLLSAPVHTDNVSLALLLAWCALTLIPHRGAAVAAVVVLGALVLTREQWGLVALPAVWLAVLLGHRRTGWALASTAVAVGTLAFTFTRPSSSEALSVTGLLETWWTEVSRSPTHAARFTFMAVFGLGLVALLPLLRVHVVRTDRRLLWLTAVAVLTVGVTVFAGQDVDRLVFPAGVVLGVVATALAARDPRLTAPWIFLVLATVLLWHPFHTLDGSPEAVLEFYALRVQPIDASAGRLRSDAAAVALPLLAAVACAFTARRPREARTPERV